MHIDRQKPAQAIQSVVNLVNNGRRILLLWSRQVNVVNAEEHISFLVVSVSSYFFFLKCFDIDTPRLLLR